MRQRLRPLWALVVVALTASVAPARAQSKTPQIRGYALAGSTTFAASQSFKAVLGTSSGSLFGGGVTVGLPWGGLYIDFGVSRFKKDGERVFVSDLGNFPLGIPVTISVTPIEVTGGWRFRGLSRRFVPYVGGGIGSYAYRESSTFSTPSEDVSLRFAGLHVVGGGEFALTRLVGVAGEVAWTRVPDALGAGGVSAAFKETDLGGRSVRVRVVVGRR